MKNDQGACTDKDGIEIRKSCMHLIHRSNHNDDDDDSMIIITIINITTKTVHSFVHVFIHSFIHSFKDLSTVLCLFHTYT